MKTAYVCGYGRSGSTLTGRVLAARHGYVAVGEVTHLASQDFLARARCSCGHPYPRCEYWAEVDRRLIDAAGPSQLRQRRRVLLEGLPGLLVPRAVLRRLVATCAFSERYPHTPFSEGVRILAAVSAHGVVDISKTTRPTANRPRLLAASGLDLELHLAWRPMLDVARSRRAASIRRGGSSRLLPAVATVLGSRFLASVAARRCSRSLRRPLRRAALKESVRLAEDLPEDDAALNHVIAGNRSRYVTTNQGTPDD